MPLTKEQQTCVAILAATGVILIIAGVVAFYSPDLSVINSTAPQSVNPGGTINYSINVENNAFAPASDVLVTSVIQPQIVTYVDVSGDGCSKKIGFETVIECSIANVSPQSNHTVNVSVTVNPNAVETDVETTIIATMNGPDLNTDDNKVALKTLVTVPP